MKRKTIICAARKIAVELTPEEQVRQNLLSLMVNQLGYPSGYLAVEKELSQIPHLSLREVKLPSRRADIICFGRGNEPNSPLLPLLLIECKAIKLSLKVINQVIGYNYFVQSPFIAVANAQEIRFGACDPRTGEYSFLPYLPRYQDLTKGP